ncbi:hypothetical protein FMN52_01790 [Marinobacter sp. BW6]|nr:hypothetical protein FMN52_01790 [Marinobacter sp. BW6]
MEGSDYLLTCAQVAVALAGFSALIVALGGQDNSGVDPLSRGLVGTLIERSLVSVFFSLGPILLSGLNLATSLLWLICSAGLAAYIASLVWRSATLRRKERALNDFLTGPAFAILMILGLLVILLQIANAFNLGLRQSVW